MSKVLVYTSPARGHLFPVMDIALALRRRGHDVHVRTIASDVDVVSAAGLTAKPIARAVEERTIDDWQAKSPIGGIQRAIAAWVDRAHHEIDDLKSAIAEEGPDLLLVDTNCFGAQAVAETSGLPWATWHPFPMPFPSDDAPPFGPGFAPARGPLGRLRDRVLRPLLFAPMQSMVPKLNVVRHKAGARPFAHITDLYLAPPLVLHLTAEPFEYPRRDWPKNMQRIGPGLWSPPSTTPGWLAKDKPVVLVTCSTEFQNDGALLHAAVAAFGEDASVQLVCTTAGVDPKTVQAPASVIVERFVPHAAVLPHVSAIVCHGGMGITQRALAASVPPCVVPFGRDQLEVGRRVVHCGAGSMLPRGKLTAARLRAAVEEARGRREGAARVSAAYTAAGGAERGASLLLDLLPSRSRAAA